MSSRSPAFTLSVLAVLIGFCVLAVNIQNAYGPFWGVFVGIGIAPVAVSRMVKAWMDRHDRG